MSKKHLRIFAGIISLFVFCQKSSKEMPWLQLELSRANFYPLEEKRQRLLQALVRFCELA